MKSLVIDDSKLERYMLSTILEEFGECDTVRNGKEGIEKFELSRSTNSRYDLICLDIVMENPDGLDTLRAIRGIEYEKGEYNPSTSPKIIMTTSVSNLEKIMEAFEDHCDEYIVKPVKRSHLKKVLIDLGLLKK